MPSRTGQAICLACIALVLGAGAFAIVRLVETFGGDYGSVAFLAFLSAGCACAAVPMLVRRMLRNGDRAPMLGWAALAVGSAVGLVLSGIGFGLRG